MKSANWRSITRTNRKYQARRSRLGTRACHRIPSSCEYTRDRLCNGTDHGNRLSRLRLQKDSLTCLETKRSVLTSSWTVFLVAFISAIVITVAFLLIGEALRSILTGKRVTAAALRCRCKETPFEDVKYTKSTAIPLVGTVPAVSDTVAILIELYARASLCVDTPIITRPLVVATATMRCWMYYHVSTANNITKPLRQPSSSSPPRQSLAPSHRHLLVMHFSAHANSSELHRDRLAGVLRVGETATKQLLVINTQQEVLPGVRASGLTVCERTKRMQQMSPVNSCLNGSAAGRHMSTWECCGLVIMRVNSFKVQ